MAITRRQLVRGSMLGLGAAALGLGPRRSHASTEFLAQADRVPLWASFPAGGLLIDGYGHPASSCTSSTEIFTGRRQRDLPLFARALALRTSPSEQPVVWVSLDVVGVSRELRQRITSALASVLEPSRLALAASHTHASSFGGGAVARAKYPALRNNPLAELRISAAQTSFRDTVVNLVRRVIAAPMTQVRLFHGRGTFASTRHRIPACGPYVPAPVDREAPVLVAINTADSSSFAVLFGCNAHPRMRICGGELDTCGNTWEEALHGDFPAIAAAELERALPNTVALFLQGCAGDQDAAGAPSLGSDEDVTPVSYADRRAAFGARGIELAAEVRRVVDRVKGDPAALVEGPITPVARTVQLPLDYGQTFGGYQVTRERLHAIYAGITECGTHRGEHARHLARLPELPTTVPFPYLLWAFGRTNPFLWFGLSGEVVSRYAFALRSHFGGRSRPWISAYVNDLHSYVPSATILAAPGACDSDTLTYHAGWARSGFLHRPAGWSATLDIAPAVAAGNLVYYGVPCRYRQDVEARILRDAVSAGDFLAALALGCSD